MSGGMGGFRNKWICELENCGERSIAQSDQIEVKSAKTRYMIIHDKIVCMVVI